jgi:dihydroorotate dehydrogenase
MRAVYPHADYLAVNVSSPNTPGLRELQGGRYVGQLLAGIDAENEALAKQHGLPPRPWLVKIAPDLSWGELDEILAASETAGASGVIATNTTISREGVSGNRAGETGGLSGCPLRERSLEVVDYVRRHAREPLTIIGVGGIRTAADVHAQLRAGADLVQIYTGLVYEGPGLPGRLLRGQV